MVRKPRGHSSTASNSFNEAEIGALNSLLNVLTRGGDGKLILRSPPMASLHRKFRRMHHNLLVTKAIDDKTSKERAAGSACTCQDQMAARFDFNPTGHYVSCSHWGTTLPNTASFPLGSAEPTCITAGGEDPSAAPAQESGDE